MADRERFRDQPEACEAVSAMLARIGDKWTILVVATLGSGPVRFNEIRRRVGDISQKMLSTTLKTLERDGFVTRTVVPTVPPQVHYELTDLGTDLLVPVSALATWAVDNSSRIAAARRRFDTERHTA